MKFSEWKPTPEQIESHNQHEMKRKLLCQELIKKWNEREKLAKLERLNKNKQTENQSVKK